MPDMEASEEQECQGFVPTVFKYRQLVVLNRSALQLLEAANPNTVGAERVWLRQACAHEAMNSYLLCSCLAILHLAAIASLYASVSKWLC